MPSTKVYDLGAPELRIESISLFEIETRPIGNGVTDLCMENIFYTITWDGEEVTPTSMPLRIIRENNEFIITGLQTDDPGDIGRHILRGRARDSNGIVIPPAANSYPYAD